MNALIRQFHRWLSIAFTLGVITNLVVYTLAGKQHQPASHDEFVVKLISLVA